MTGAPTRRRSQSTAVVLAPVAAIALGAAAAIPASALTGGPTLCPFRLLTGLPCPVCGLTRSWVATAHGDLVAGLQFNPFGPVTMAVALLMVLIAVRAWVRPEAPRASATTTIRVRPVLVGTLVVAGIYGMVRMVAVHAGTWPWPY